MGLDIDKVAELACIRLKADEKETLSRDLASILDYVEQLKEVNTENVAETSHVLDLMNVFRPDEVSPSQAVSEVLKHAPSSEGKFFKVPKVVDR